MPSTMFATRAHLVTLAKLAAPHPRAGLVLPSEIHAIVKNTTGAPRIVAVVGPDRQYFTQDAFSAAVGECWSDIASTDQEILRWRALNPRRALSVEEMRAHVDAAVGAHSLAHESRALALLAERFSKRHCQMHILPGEHTFGATPLYFLPAPVESDTALSERSGLLDRMTATTRLLALVDDSVMDCCTAAIAFNAWISAFTLTTPELSAYFHTTLTNDFIDTHLAEGARILHARGLEIATWQPVEDTRPDRERYARHFAGISIPDRIALAQSTTDDKILRALCFDFDPKVMSAILCNDRSGLQHARLLAEHHPTTLGLELLTRYPHFLIDAKVRAMLLRNAVASDGLLRRTLASCTLELRYQLFLGHEKTERATKITKAAVREKFPTASPEERAQLIIRTEGRCLPVLVSLPIDRPTAKVLCAVEYPSLQLVINLTNFAGTPRNVLEHFLRKSVVQRSPAARHAITQRLKKTV